MLMALLYCEPDRIGAGALACEQLPFGDAYWNEMHAAAIEPGSIFETAHIEIKDAELCERLLAIGITSQCDGKILAERVEQLKSTKLAAGRAA